MSKKMDPSKMGDNEILELFENEFKSSVIEVNGFSDPEFEIERVVGSKNINVSVRLYGMAGAPNYDQYKDLENTSKIRIERYDKGYLNFILNKDDIVVLGSNEYMVSYTSK